MNRKVIRTADAPAAIGTYSHAIRSGEFVFVSGQLGLDPRTGDLASGGAEAEARQVFRNLAAVAKAAGADLDAAIKLTVYLVDLSDYSRVNEIMREFFSDPYPARAAVGIAALPRGARIEVEAILAL